MVLMSGDSSKTARIGVCVKPLPAEAGRGEESTETLSKRGPAALRFVSNAWSLERRRRGQRFTGREPQDVQNASDHQTQSARH